MKTIAIIPARYGSTRFPGKPLALLGGRPLVQWPYIAAREVFDEVVVATDDERIAHAVEDFGGRAVISSMPHTCGTSRVQEAKSLLYSDADIVVNIQGDEPLISPDDMRSLLRCFDEDTTEIATLVWAVHKDDYDALFDTNRVKVVIDLSGHAMYFTRATVPHVRGQRHERWLDHATYYTHIGIYAYRSDAIDRICKLDPTPLERAESLEQLRWLQHGYRIRCCLAYSPTIGIDTPEDLARANEYISK